MTANAAFSKRDVCGPSWARQAGHPAVTLELKVAIRPNPGVPPRRLYCLPTYPLREAPRGGGTAYMSYVRGSLAYINLTAREKDVAVPNVRYRRLGSPARRCGSRSSRNTLRVLWEMPILGLLELKSNRTQFHGHSWSQYRYDDRGRVLRLYGREVGPRNVGTDWGKPVLNPSPSDIHKKIINNVSGVLWSREREVAAPWTVLGSGGSPCLQQRPARTGRCRRPISR
jgi:hypothetical protein